MDREPVRNSLYNAGFTDVQSETLSHILAQMATREDLQILRAELRADISSMRSDLLTVVERTARETQAQMTKTMVGVIVSLATIFTLLDVFID